MKMEGRCECKTALKRLTNVFQTSEDDKKQGRLQDEQLAEDKIGRRTDKKTILKSLKEKNGSLQTNQNGKINHSNISLNVRT